MITLVWSGLAIAGFGVIVTEIMIWRRSRREHKEAMARIQTAIDRLKANK